MQMAEVVFILFNSNLVSHKHRTSNSVHLECKMVCASKDAMVCSCVLADDPVTESVRGVVFHCGRAKPAGEVSSEKCNYRFSNISKSDL